MIQFLEHFHFLRPLWLTLIPVVVVVWWFIRRKAQSGEQSSTTIAPHLLAALTVGRSEVQKIRPADLMAAMLIVTVFAVSGPAWNKVPSPWFSESAPLVVAIEVSDSMRSNDVLPTRLDRARFKILDLMESRTGARTALIAYAGSAHIVMPPTTDVNVIKPFLEGLDPDIMPKPGESAASVLSVAISLLSEEDSRGSLLFVNDGFDPAESAEFSQFASSENAPTLAALVFGTEQGGVAIMPDGSPVIDTTGGRLKTGVDKNAINQISRASSMLVEFATTGDSDLRSLLNGIQSKLLQADDPESMWRDQAWWFTLPAALLLLWGFRKGWVIQ